MSSSSSSSNSSNNNNSGKITVEEFKNSNSEKCAAALAGPVGIQVVIDNEAAAAMEALVSSFDAFGAPGNKSMPLDTNDEVPLFLQQQGKFVRSQAVKFKPLPSSKVFCYDPVMIRKKYGHTFSSFHFVRSAEDSHLYIVHVTLRVSCMQVQRFRRLLLNLARAMCRSRQVYARSYTLVDSKPANKLREVAGYKRENIFILIDDRTTGVIQQQAYLQNIDIPKLHEQLKSEFMRLMTSICLAPTAYDTILRKVRYMDATQLGAFLRERDLNTLFKEVQGQVFDMAAAEVCKKEQTYVIVRDENFRTMICSSLYDKVYPLFIMCILGRTDYTHGHPSITNSIWKNTHMLFQQNVSNLAVYHSDFIVSVLLVSRYFAKVCMQQAEFVSSNQATLLLYGAAGAGKSLLTNAIIRYANGYKWNSDSMYQSPQLLSSSVIVMEEIRLEQLNNSLCKQVLDYTSPVKVEMKNTHPVDASYHCPVIMNTNDDVHQFFTSSLGRQCNLNFGGDGGGRKLGKSHSSGSGIEAIHRRLYMVPFIEKFTRLHDSATFIRGWFTEGSSSNVKKEMQRLVKEFQDIERATPQLFNFMVAFSLFQEQYSNFEVVDKLKAFYKQLVRRFRESLFGRVYLIHKETIDSQLSHLEDILLQEQCEERLMQRHFARVSSEVERLINDQMEQVVAQSKDSDVSGLWEDKRFVRLGENCRFMQRLLVLQAPSVRKFLEEADGPCCNFEGVVPVWREVLEADLEVPDFEEGNEASVESVLQL